MELRTPEDTSIFEAIYTTRALRRFKPDPVPDALLFQALDAAIRAPAGGNNQNWHFVIIRDESKRRQVGEWYLEGWMKSYYGRFEENPALIDELSRQQQLVVRSASHLAHNMGKAPVLVFAAGPRGAAATVYPAVQNFLLACRALGLGSVLTTLFQLNAEKIAALLGVPDNYQLFALLPVGWPTDRFGPVTRTPLVEHVSLDHWNTPWEYAQAQPEHGLRDKWAG